MAEREWVANLIIGSGEAGKWMAWELGRAGQPAVVVERRWIGGSCPNINCLPSKNEIHSAKVAHVVRHAAAFGTEVTGARTHMPSVLARKRKMVEDEIAGHLALYRRARTELVLGEARFVAPRTVEVRLKGGGTRLLTGERVFLNLGTRPSLPAIPGLAGAAMTNIELLELDQLPDHLVVLGGGYVGIEFAQAYRRFGSCVTIVERGPQLLAHEDPDVSRALSQLLVDEGVEVRLDAATMRVDGTRGAWRISVRHNGGDEQVNEASHVLAALGRTPNTDGIGLDLAGVELDARGYIAVNDRLETTAPGVWAMGECAGSLQFTHVAFDDFRVVHANLFGGHRSTRGRIIPFCLFTDPELARVGLNESEAARRGVAVRVATLPIQNVLRTETTGESRGFMKALIDARSDQILGFTMFGAEAGEVAAIVQTAMTAGLPYTSLRDLILAHPTM
ncbi:MAG TPA: FAD-dependent oxidoreductase, partial [Stellaceae bacterium]|nr:FAD-dependent oxidoreductase [Stellaceae bacterium]